MKTQIRHSMLPKLAACPKYLPKEGPAGPAAERGTLIDKAVRLANYVTTLRKELLVLCHACGVEHPSQVTADRIEILDDRYGATTVADLLGGRGSHTPGAHPHVSPLAFRPRGEWTAAAGGA